MRPATKVTRGTQPGPPPDEAAWTFLTNHAHVLVCLTQDDGLTVDEIARRVGITERSTRRIIGDLEEAGYLARRKVGRNNRYALDPSRPLRHPLEHHRNVGALLSLVRKESR